MLTTGSVYTPAELHEIMGPHWRQVVYLVGQIPELRGSVERHPDGTVVFGQRFVAYYNNMPDDQAERIHAIAAMP